MLNFNNLSARLFIGKCIIGAGTVHSTREPLISLAVQPTTCGNNPLHHFFTGNMV